MSPGASAPLAGQAHAIRVRRIYEPPLPDDGARVLVDRLWPRGVRKAAAALDLWLKEVAPSAPLRRWFGHDPARWAEFATRYRAELAANAGALEPLRERARAGSLTLLHAARDRVHNHAVVLADCLRGGCGAQADTGPGGSVDLSSSPCFAADADERYMGGIGREELSAALNELLEAERAGARVAQQSARGAPAAVAALLRAIQHDEAHWCALLTGAIRRLGGKPSRRTGEFHAKAMAIDDLPARLDFLNRGQRWVVRRLQALLPRLRDDRLLADLAAMLAAHEDNIARGDGAWRRCAAASANPAASRRREASSRRGAVSR